MSVFEKFLSLWVALCILVGIGLGQLFPDAFQAIGAMEVACVICRCSPTSSPSPRKPAAPTSRVESSLHSSFKSEGGGKARPYLPK